MSSFKLSAETRVRTSDGEASFVLARPRKGNLELGNDYPGQWLKLPAETVIEPVATYSETDTFMLAVTIPGEKDPKGLILRKMSYEKILANKAEITPKAPKAPKAKVGTAEPAEAVVANDDQRDEVATDGE